jgi:hypothetical protein
MKIKIMTGLICFLMLSVMLFVPTGAEAASSWGPTQTVGTNSNWADNPQIAMDDNGNAIAVWTEAGQTVEGLYYYVYACHFSPSSGWGQPEPIQQIFGANGQARSPQVAMNSNGNAVVVWLQTNGSAVLIESNFYAPGLGWGVAKKLGFSDSSANNLNVAIDEGGNATATLTALVAAHVNLYAYRYTATSGTWSAWAGLESLNGDVVSSDVAMDKNGNALVIWSQYDGTYNSIYSNKYSAIASSWGVATLLEPWTNNAATPQLAMEKNGSAVAIWLQVNSGSAWGIFGSKYTPTGGWASSPDTINSNTSNTYNPQVAISDQGTILVVCSQTVGSNRAIYANTGSMTGPYGASERVGPIASTTGQFRPEVAFDDGGNAIVAWYTSLNQVYTNTYLSATPGSGTWGTPTLQTSNGAYPEIAMGGPLEAFILWQNPIGSNVYIKGYAENVQVSISTLPSTVSSPTIFVVGTTNHASSLVINGFDVRINQDGSYGAVIPLLDGSNVIMVEAYNETWYSYASASASVTYENLNPSLLQSIANTDANVTALNVLLTSTRGQLDSVNAQLMSAYASGNMTSRLLSLLNDKVTAAQNTIIVLRSSLNSTDSNLTLSSSGRSSMSALLNQTLSDLGTTKTNLATAQMSLRSTQNTQSSDETMFFLLGLIGIILAILATVMVFLRTRKPKSGQT